MILAAILCTAPAYAVSYEAARASGLSEPVALDRVGKAAGRQVCGVWRGYAVIVETRTEAHDGCLYRITRFRFLDRRREDAWRAESIFVPEDVASDGRT